MLFNIFQKIGFFSLHPMVDVGEANKYSLAILVLLINSKTPRSFAYPRITYP